MEEVLARPRPLPKVRIPALNVALFLLTIATTVWAGFVWFPPASGAVGLREIVASGLPFSAALLSILFCHEMGHYVLARRHGVDSTLPFFIPVPLGVGTFGAVIRIRSALPSRRAVLDIGAAGPLAGFAVALPLLLWGLAHSEVRAVAPVAAGTAIASPFDLVRFVLRGLGEHRPLLRVLQDLVRSDHGDLLTMGDSLITWTAQQLVVGPLPRGHEVMIHPVAFAAWVGLLVTTLNLVPFGQLDGGHVTYALLGRARARLLSRLVSSGLLLFGLFGSWSWLVWWGLTRFVVRPGHPPALVEEPLDPARRAVALFSLALFVVTFLPRPIS